MITFKKFCAALEQPEVNEASLTEIFGWSSKERQEKGPKAVKAVGQLKNKLSKEKEKEMVKRAGGLNAWMTGKNAPKKDERTPSTASAGRAAERQWVADLLANKAS
jgi:hypothetical protein